MFLVIISENDNLLVKDLSQILRILVAFSFAVLCSLYFTCEDTDLLNFSKHFDFEIHIEALNIVEKVFMEFQSMFFV